MTSAEKKLVEQNLDLIFEFEKYVLEHPEITEKIPRNAVVFMKVIGDEKFIYGVSAGRGSKPGREFP
jgi:histidine ammonia-lyase